MSLIAIPASADDRISARSRVSERELLRQRSLVDYLRNVVTTGPEDRERFHAVFLDEVHAILGDAPLGEGGRGTLSFRMREVFALALGLGASGLIVAHNHPSGQCRPSRCDIDATRRLKGVANALDIELVDHLIITRSAVYSMRAGGNL